MPHQLAGVVCLSVTSLTSLTALAGSALTAFIGLMLRPNPDRPDVAGRAARPGNAILGIVKVAQGRVVNGTVVTETRLPEGARVAIVLDDDQPPFDLDPEDELAIETAVKDLDAGAGKPVSELGSMLARYR